MVIASLIAMVVAMVLVMIGIMRAKGGLRKGGKGEGDEESEAEGGEKWPWQFTPFQKLSFSVDEVVRRLVDANVIGKGCSGVVYRVDVDNGEAIAVKKLWPSSCAVNTKDDAGGAGVRDSFSAEVRTLGTIRHKNIVRFLGCCWNKNTRLLMYDYMANGSLGGLLHERTGFSLEWDLRYRIVLGAAQGLAYLHHDCVPPIVHRDIKANNILIGLDFEPYIADFGLAKLVNAEGDFGRSSNTVAGSYGYIAPEYGYMMKITEKSDVYSYGVVVLEVLTGKQPIDPTIPDGLHVVDWVRRRRGCASYMDVLDQSMRGRPESELDEMLQVLGVALLCVNPYPDERPTMKDVAAMLKEIRLEREEYAKVDVLIKGSSVAPQGGTTSSSSSTTSSSLCQNNNNNNCFSATTSQYSSSSKA
ncbi:Receptor-like protein kinase 2 [Acorus calamus]|uniref:Receptor-like protein kinase 2 n=1 Tax=Acorus calamus TaxID=4465 RepID=A0AAV9C442_ACOCL|nr:Receptor-like protein kinase 2 [Acorus calamus]